MKKILLLQLCILISVLSCGNDNTKFISSKWISGNYTERGKMSRDLIDSHILVGKSENQVEELLGTPDRIFDDAYTYEIDIGTEFGSKPWNYLVYIQFKKNIVVDCYMTD